ncbi:MAG: ubiquinone/menaquinone biosynthesis methyltransferase [Cyanobacteria bacterium REEB65]|nr:ubiquinone/menaquinone biosynthesis methyltransferase [Cyanobacteria bacterium REEB65]
MALPTGEERAAYVRSLFDGIADRYDRMNDLMTVGLHRSWKRDLLRQVGVRPGESVLDVCTGTGDLALLLKEAVGPGGSVKAIDFSAQMLEQAKGRPGARDVDWLAGDATALPFADASFDRVTVGFGLRNVASLGAALAEARRVLRPGGSAGSLDLSKSRVRGLAKVIHVYEFMFVPLLARLSGAPEAAYRYLPESNRAFPDRAGLVAQFESAGFSRIVAHNRAFGAIAIVTGTKPAALGGGSSREARNGGGAGAGFARS